MILAKFSNRSFQNAAVAAKERVVQDWKCYFRSLVLAN